MKHVSFQPTTTYYTKNLDDITAGDKSALIKNLKDDSNIKPILGTILAKLVNFKLHRKGLFSSNTKINAQEKQLSEIHQVITGKLDNNHTTANDYCTKFEQIVKNRTIVKKEIPAQFKAWLKEFLDNANGEQLYLFIEGLDSSGAKDFLKSNGIDLTDIITRFLNNSDNSLSEYTATLLKLCEEKAILTKEFCEGFLKEKISNSDDLKVLQPLFDDINIIELVRKARTLKGVIENFFILQLSSTSINESKMKEIGEVLFKVFSNEEGLTSIIKVLAEYGGQYGDTNFNSLFSDSQNVSAPKISTIVTKLIEDDGEAIKRNLPRKITDTVVKNYANFFSNYSGNFSNEKFKAIFTSEHAQTKSLIIAEIIRNYPEKFLTLLGEKAESTYNNCIRLIKALKIEDVINTLVGNKYILVEELGKEGFIEFVTSLLMNYSDLWCDDNYDKLFNTIFTLPEKILYQEEITNKIINRDSSGFKKKLAESLKQQIKQAKSKEDMKNIGTKLFEKYKDALLKAMDNDENKFIEFVSNLLTHYLGVWGDDTFNEAFTLHGQKYQEQITNKIIDNKFNEFKERLEKSLKQQIKQAKSEKDMENIGTKLFEKYKDILLKAMDNDENKFIEFVSNLLTHYLGVWGSKVFNQVFNKGEEYQDKVMKSKNGDNALKSFENKFNRIIKLLDKDKDKASRQMGNLGTLFKEYKDMYKVKDEHFLENSIYKLFSPLSIKDRILVFHAFFINYENMYIKRMELWLIGREAYTYNEYTNRTTVKPTQIIQDQFRESEYTDAESTFKKCIRNGSLSSMQTLGTMLFGTYQTKLKNKFGENFNKYVADLLLNDYKSEKSEFSIDDIRAFLTVFESADPKEANIILNILEKEYKLQAFSNELFLAEKAQFLERQIAKELKKLEEDLHDDVLVTEFLEEEKIEEEKIASK